MRAAALACDAITGTSLVPAKGENFSRISQEIRVGAPSGRWSSMTLHFCILNGRILCKRPRKENDDGYQDKHFDTVGARGEWCGESNPALDAVPEANGQTDASTSRGSGVCGGRHVSIIESLFRPKTPDPRGPFRGAKGDNARAAARPGSPSSGTISSINGSASKGSGSGGWRRSLRSIRPPCRGLSCGMRSGSLMASRGPTGSSIRPSVSGCSGG